MQFLTELNNLSGWGPKISPSACVFHKILLPSGHPLLSSFSLCLICYKWRGAGTIKLCQRPTLHQSWLGCKSVPHSQHESCEVAKLARHKLAYQTNVKTGTTGIGARNGFSGAFQRQIVDEEEISEAILPSLSLSLCLVMRHHNEGLRRIKPSRMIGVIGLSENGRSTDLLNDLWVGSVLTKRNRLRRINIEGLPIPKIFFFFHLTSKSYSKTHTT